MAARRLRLERTLGPLVVSWIEANLVHGPGDVQGQKVELDDEQVRFLLRAYEIDGNGKRLIRRAVYSRAKGRAKSEMAAFVVCAEALGPVRFRGWAEDGRPLGGPITAPLIRCAATEEGQADNTYAAAEFMLREGPVSATPGLDVGMTRTFLPGGGKIVAISAKASSKDGGLESFVNFDETHLYSTPELHRLHSTIRRNLGKRRAAEPWSLETSTMYAPGEGSVAEHSHSYAKAIRSGQLKDPSFLFDHRQGPREFDFSDDGQLRSALLHAYGEAAGWMDIERLIAEARDPQTLESDFRRYFLNQPTERHEGKWITDERWEQCSSVEQIPPNAEIVVGVDAATTRDTTAVAWAWAADPEKTLARARVWTTIQEKPHHVYVAGGRLDNDMARDFITDVLMRKHRVGLLCYDPRYFETQANDLSEEGLTVAAMQQGQNEMLVAWDEFYEAVHRGPKPSFFHDDDPIIAEHVSAAVGVKTDRRGWKVSKVKSDKPIDGLAAMVMAHYGARHTAAYRKPRRTVTSVALW